MRIMVDPRSFRHRRYLDSKADDEEIHLIQDGVVVSKIELYLSQEENRVINKRIQKIIMEAGQNKPEHARKRYVFSYVVIPIDA